MTGVVRELQEQARFDAVDSHLAQNLRISLLFSFIFLRCPDRQPGTGRRLYAGIQIVDGTLTLGEWQFSLFLCMCFPLGQLGFIISLMSQAARPRASLRSSTRRTRSRASPARSSWAA